MIDTKLAGLLSDFFLDIGKAFFIGAFVTPSLSGKFITPDLVTILMNGIISVTISLWLAREFLEISKQYESN